VTDADGDGYDDDLYNPGTGDPDAGAGNGPPGPAGNPNQGGGGTDDGGIAP
jgi:hypothetical protein